MTDELQSLLQRLQRDGVDAGRKQADEVLQQAKSEASRIVAEAESEAKRRLEVARVEADGLQQRAKATLQHAARDLLLVFGQRIEALVKKLVEDKATAALDGPTVVKLATHLIDGFVARGRASSALDLVVGPELQHDLTTAVLNGLRERLQQGITLHVQPGVGRGFQVRMGEGGVTHDFTGQALAAAIADLVTPHIGAVVLEAAVKPAAARA